MIDLFAHKYVFPHKIISELTVSRRIFIMFVKSECRNILLQVVLCIFSHSWDSVIASEFGDTK